ncbi:hypothetical protein ACU4GH_28240 [Bradyrhizobium betae]
MTKEIFGKIFVRALIEFGPPTIIGALWAYYNYMPGMKTADSITHFSAAFVVIAMFWLNLLRIQHQTTTRVQQTQLAGGVQNVDTQIKDIGIEIGVVKATLATLTEKLDAVMPKVRDEDAIEITNLVRTANNHIETANTKFDAVRNYAMKAEDGKLTITLPSE